MIKISVAEYFTLGFDMDNFMAVFELVESTEDGRASALMPGKPGKHIEELTAEEKNALRDSPRKCEKTMRSDRPSGS